MDFKEKGKLSRDTSELLTKSEVGISITKFPYEGWSGDRFSGLLNLHGKEVNHFTIWLL